MIYAVIHILFYLLFAFLMISTFYLLFLAVAGLFYRSVPLLPSALKKKIAVLITSHNEDNIIIETVRSAIEHNYPSDKFGVFVAADHLKAETIRELKNSGAHIFEVHFSRSSKARSLNLLLNRIDASAYDIAVVLDGDNIMMPGFLEKINLAFLNGSFAVQGHRTAKNQNTEVAILDAISEEVNNHLFRKSPSVLGLSSSLIGSGMAFDFKKLREIYNKPGILDNPACDREVDFEMLKSRTTIEYLNDAFVLDEKVSSKRIYENQRRRWLESQLMHLRLFFSKRERVKKTTDYWNKLFINLIPPRILMLSVFFAVFCLCVIQYFSKVNLTGLSFIFWLIPFAAYLISILLSIPPRYYNLATLKAFVYLPALLVSFLKAAFTIRLNRKDFVHTPKTFTRNSSSTKELP